MKSIKVLFAKECVSHHKVVKHEFLEKPHYFEYDDNTKMIDLFRSLFDSSGMFFYEESICIRDGKGNLIEENHGQMEITDDMLIELFQIEYNGNFVSIRDNTVIVNELFTYMGITNELIIFFNADFGGLGAVKGLNIDGIRYDFRFKESNHPGRPHIHAFYQGKWITIDLRALTKIKGEFKTEKYERKAIEQVAERQEQLLANWNDMIHGINPF